ncbi:MAG: DUF6599 family protein [Candidatus Aminicenantales bacterium]
MNFAARFLTVASAAILFSLTGAIQAAAPAFPDDPPDDFAPGWKAAGPPRTFIEQDLFNHIDGGAELFLEFGFLRLAVQTYAKGEEELVCEVYEMTHAAGALGIYLMHAGRETPWTDIPARNSSEDAQIVAVKGNVLLKIDNFGPGKDLRPAMIALARAALAPIPDTDTGDPFSRLPSPGRVPGSERLIGGPVGLQPYYSFGEGDILGLAVTTPAVLAEYASGEGKTFSRLIVDYPSAETAAGVLKNLRVNHDPYITIFVGNDPDGFIFEDFQKKYGRVRRRASRLDIVFKATAPDWE